MITYRKATTDDVNSLVELRLKFIKEAQNVPEGDDDSKINRQLRDYFKQYLKTNEFVAWLALNDGKIIATSGLCFYVIPPNNKNKTGRVAYIMNMFTLPEYRRNGIARELFGRIVKEAVDLGYGKIVLHATKDGRPLYEQFGFKLCDDEMVFFTDRAE